MDLFMWLRSNGLIMYYDCKWCIIQSGFWAAALGEYEDQTASCLFVLNVSKCSFAYEMLEHQYINILTSYSTLLYAYVLRNDPLNNTKSSQYTFTWECSWKQLFRPNIWFFLSIVTAITNIKPNVHTILHNIIISDNHICTGMGFSNVQVPH